MSRSFVRPIFSPEGSSEATCGWDFKIIRVLDISGAEPKIEKPIEGTTPTTIDMQ
jgi:hypothetical protein